SARPLAVWCRASRAARVWSSTSPGRAPCSHRRATPTNCSDGSRPRSVRPTAGPAWAVAWAGSSAAINLRCGGAASSGPADVEVADVVAQHFALGVVVELFDLAHVIEGLRHAFDVRPV